MAKNIYDKDGRKVGEIKSEREAAEDDFAAVCDNIGCVMFFIGGFIVLFTATAWCMAIYEAIEESNAFYLFWAIPIVISTVIAGRKIALKNLKSFWSVFWRIALIDVGVGTVIGLVAVLIYEGYMDAEAFVGSIFLAAVYSLIPAIIATWVVRRKKRK